MESALRFDEFVATAVSWPSILVVEEAGVPGENHRPWASNCNFYHWWLRVECTTMQHNYRKPYINQGSSWQWSYDSWIYNYLCNQCPSPLMLWVLISIRAGCTTLCPPPPTQKRPYTLTKMNDNIEMDNTMAWSMNVSLFVCWNSEKIWIIWKKSQFNSEIIWTIWKKDKLNSGKIWRIWKKK
jgi:hypothetical protein